MENLRTFSLPTLFWATAVVAVFAGAYVWMGLAGLVLFIAMAMGIFAGLWGSAIFGLGFAFADLRADITKCLIVASVVCGITYMLIMQFGGLGAGVLPICWLIAMKLCWDELEKPALVLTFATTFMFPAIVAGVVLVAIDA